VVEDALASLLLALDPLPAVAHRAGAREVLAGKHVGMPADKLGMDSTRYLLEIPRVFFLERQRKEENLEQ
jgi:hypothetical protein